MYPRYRILRVLAGFAVLSIVNAQELPLLRVLGRPPRRTVPGRVGQALSSNNIALENIQQYTYVLPATIGRQDFEFIWDTGSSDLWVVDTSCQEGDCTSVPRYSQQLSDTLISTEQPFKLSYLTGNVEGEIIYDTVRVGEYQVQSQALATVYQTADLDLASTATSGIAGFCFPGSAAIPAAAGATLLENLLSAFPPDQQYFAFLLPRDGSTGSLTLGSLNPTLVPDPTLINYSPVVRTGLEYDYWKLSLQHLTVDGRPFPISSSRVPGAVTPIAILDTGTTLILGPSEDVKAFYALFGTAARNDPVNGYQIRCTRAVPVGLVLGAHEYPLHPADIAWAEGAQDGWCTGGLQANDNVNAGDWLCGDTFLRNVLAVHKYSTTQSSIGMLSVTNITAAMQEFRAERGEDVADGDTVEQDDSDVAPMEDGSDGWDTTVEYVKRWEHHSNGKAARMFGAAAGSLGFVVGGITAAGWRFWHGV
ncbi:aspartic peptidase domain-containing protein [Mycena sanguinolenta]|nr:aspartic peptidase domain-containing protein [Mycena sanguinolenta]